MIDHLPVDILLEISYHLPVFSILHLQNVCTNSSCAIWSLSSDFLIPQDLQTFVQVHGRALCLEQCFT